MQKNELYLKGTFPGQMEEKCVPNKLLSLLHLLPQEFWQWKLQCKSVLNFEVHSQLLFLCVCGTAGGTKRKSNQPAMKVMRYWKHLGEIQWSIWMKVWAPLLPTSQLWAGQPVFLISSSCISDVAAGLESQRCTTSTELLILPFLTWDLSYHSPISHIPGSASVFPSSLWYLPSVRLILPHYVPCLPLNYKGWSLLLCY